MTLNVVVTGTGPLFTLDEAKAHLRVEHGDDDGIIETYAEAAVSRVMQYCNIATVPAGDLPVAAFKTAALMVLSAIYENPNAGTMPRAAELLIDPYRWLRV